MRAFRRFFLLLICLSFAVTGAAKELWETLPETGEPVKDFAGLLSGGRRESLVATLRDFHDKTGAGLTVVTVTSLEGADIESVSNRLFNRWGVGEKSNNKGVLLLIAKNDRRMRIECGYGAEAVVPDAIAKRIIAEDITPHFKAGDFAGGIDAGSRSIMARFGYDAPGAPPSVRSVSADADGFDDSLSTVILLAVFFVFFVVVAIFGKGRGRRNDDDFFNSGGWGGGAGGSSGGGWSGSGGGSSGGGGASGSW